MKDLIALLAGRYFDDFRVEEFCAAVGGAFGAGKLLCQQMGVPDQAAFYVGVLCAVIAAACYIRNPKSRQWESRHGEAVSEAQQPEADEATEEAA